MKRLALFLLSLCAVSVRAANWPDRPVLQAVRATGPITIDGDLSEPVWQSAPEFTDFTQHDPHDGEPGTTRTSFRVLYDDQAIYFGAILEDTHPPTGQLARRDSFTNSDFLSINLDPQQDRLSGNAFTVSPSNVQVDTILFNDIGEDGSWDGVWESQTRVLPSGGWVAEVRVPFSQLRFPEKASHTWGINVTRRTTRTNEWVRIVNTRKGDTGFVSHFAELTGLDGIRRERPFEIIPYVVARADVLTRDTNPLVSSRQQRMDAGLDLKYALTSTLTLTGTINPDFGQVEVDPAVVNLSQFETFYPEKRPFFTEGLNIFNFADSPSRTQVNFIDPPRMFYSRRIGRPPQTRVEALAVAQPVETTILGAGKVTGKMGKWSVGVLDALTDAERARYYDQPDDVRRVQVEPMTNYFISRMTRELGTSRIGFMVNSVNRRMTEELTPLLRENALTAGVDGYTLFRDASWILEWNAVASRVTGSQEAIALTQLSSARYYQRPDADHVEFDPTRTSLSGQGGKLALSKQTGVWRPILQVQGYSPGFETNDAGFMQRADLFSAQALMYYVNETPTPRFRDKRVLSGVWMNRNFDGDTLERGVFADFETVLANYWEVGAEAFYSGSAFSDQLTRGGPLVRTLPGLNTSFEVQSDNRKPLSFAAEVELYDNEDGTYAREVGIGIEYRPKSNLVFSLTPAVERTHEAHQVAGRDENGVIFAELEQRTFELATRVDWTLSSRLSFQLFAQPFIASGDFHDPHVLAQAGTADYVPYQGTLREPDFNLRSIRASAVARWEFRPGSALYVVWNENRAEEVSLGDFRLRRDARGISRAPSHDVFLVKVSYWLPL